jgi:DHA1 family bicyclomycin/chloramphenicol resistance-like MFS transporter
MSAPPDSTAASGAPSPVAVGTASAANAVRRPPPIALLISVAAIGPGALNLFLPSIPGLARAFDTSFATVQLALTLYLVGLALGPLLYGPLSDRFGRRPILLAGCGLFVVGSILCAIAPAISVLNLGRLLQALGASAGTVVARAGVYDIYGRDRSASALGYVTMVTAVAPAVAPGIGGVLDVWFGWRASFILVLALGAVVLGWAIVAGRETHFTRVKLPGIGAFLRSFGTLLSTRAYLGYALFGALSAGAFFSFLGGAPHLVIDVLQRPPSEYGFYFLAVSVAYMAGNFLAGRLSQRLGTERMIALGFAIMLTAVLMQLVVAFTLPLSSFLVFMPMVITAVGNGASLPNAIAGAVAVHPRLAGAGAGLFGFLQMTLGAVGTVVLGLIAGTTQVPLACVMATCVVGAGLAYWLGVARPGRPRL